MTFKCQNVRRAAWKLCSVYGMMTNELNPLFKINLRNYY